MTNGLWMIAGGLASVGTIWFLMRFFAMGKIWDQQIAEMLRRKRIQRRQRRGR